MERFSYVLSLLPASVGKSLAECKRAEEISEIRLRLGQALSIIAGGKEQFLGPVVSREALETLLERSTNASPYAAKETLAQGYVSARYGIRIGFCGEIVSASGLMKNLSSAAIRLPSEQRGWGRRWAEPFSSTLILSPPGCGKTTLLRDMVRLLSDGGERVGLCDDRGELAAVWEGKPGFDVGRCTDVITGGERSRSALMLLRNMSPTVIAMDELTGERELNACLAVSRCGVRLLATAHAADRKDLERRNGYRTLLEQGVFRRLLLIDREHRVREELL